MVNEDFALAHARKGAVWPQCHLTQIIVVSDTCHHKILAFGRGFWSRCRLATVLLDPLFGFGSGPVIDRDFVAAFVLQMPGHRVAHDTKTEKRHFRHLQTPLKISSAPLAGRGQGLSANRSLPGWSRQRSKMALLH